MTSKSRTSTCAGFSLIELIFAMFFMTVIILGVVSLQSSNLGMINRQNNEIQAHFYANQGLEIASALSSALIDGDFAINDPSPNYSLSSSLTDPEKGNLIPPDNLFYRKIEVDGSEVTYKVIAIITWEDSTGLHDVSAKRIIQP